MSLEIYLKKNQYRLDQVLGQGGMARVYLAMDLLHKRRVAVKQTLLPKNGDAKSIAKLVARFKREYHFLSAINHPNIVRAYDLLMENKQLFMVIEYVSGISLQELIVSRPNSLNLLEQLAIASQIVKGLEVLNSAGILHRDLKPENVMLNEDTKLIKVLDLGLGAMMSSDMARLTNVGTTVGTPEYMSPEQIAGDISASTDVFSLGTTLYQFFSWLEVSPFRDESTINTMRNVAKKDLPPLIERIHRPMNAKEKNVYEDLSEVLEHALEKDPRLRIASARHLSNEIDRLYRSMFASAQETFVEEPSFLEDDSEDSKKTWEPSICLEQEELDFLAQLGEKYGRDVILKPKESESAKEKVPGHKKRLSRPRNPTVRQSGFSWLWIFAKKPPTKVVKISLAAIAIVFFGIVGWAFTSSDTRAENKQNPNIEHRPPEDPFVQELTAEEQNRAWLRQMWPSWFHLKDERRKLETAMGLIAQYQNGKDSSVRLTRLLDDLAQEFNNTYDRTTPRQLSYFLFHIKEMRGAFIENRNDPNNDNLVHVIQNKQGTPLSLALIYILVGRRLGLEIEGCDFPGHFLARVNWRGQRFYIDCWQSGQIMSREFLKSRTRMTKKHYDSLSETPDAVVIITRVLKNLQKAYDMNGRKKDSELMVALLKVTK